jgi:hypothetical protein
VDAAGWGTSTGSIIFVGDNPGALRHIATNNAAFSRDQHYIAFPNLTINTADAIHVPEYLGLDAVDIARGANGTDGVLYLESNPQGATVYDASLRLRGTAAAGAVVVEKYILPFRITSTNAYLFPFASPYTNQRAGYYAGNWVRHPQEDANHNYLYPYANKQADTPPYINASQYLLHADDYFAAGDPYLIKLRPAGAPGYDPYENLEFLQTAAGGSHDLDKFIFDGTPYNLAYEAETLYTGEFSRTTRSVQTSPATTQNWVFGNTYTSGLSSEALIAQMINHPDIYFSGILYVYPPGATGYQAYSMSNPAAVPDIPAMSVFMLIVSNRNGGASAPNGLGKTFTVGHDLQRHITTDGSGSGPVLSSAAPGKAPAAPRQQLAFRLSPADNPFIYDAAAVSLEAAASEASDASDVAKLLNTTNLYFQLYSQSAAKAKLQTNALPESVVSTALCVSPPDKALECRLTVAGRETVTTEDLILYDAKTRTYTDLRATDEYVFLAEPLDAEERFTLYFKSPTAIEALDLPDLHIYADERQLVVEGLLPSDTGSRLSLYTTSGVLLQQVTIGDFPRFTTPVSLPKNVYIARIEGGKRTVTLKFVIL